MPWKSDFVRKIDFVISDIFKKIPVELMLFDIHTFIKFIL